MEKGMLMHVVSVEYDNQQLRHGGATAALNDVSTELSKGSFQIKVNHCMMADTVEGLSHGIVVVTDGTPGLVLTRSQLVRMLVALEVEPDLQEDYAGRTLN